MRMYEEDRFVYLHIINNNLFDWYKPTLDHFFWTVTFGLQREKWCSRNDSDWVSTTLTATDVTTINSSTSFVTYPNSLHFPTHINFTLSLPPSFILSIFLFIFFSLSLNSLSTLFQRFLPCLPSLPPFCFISLCLSTILTYPTNTSLFYSPLFYICLSLILSSISSPLCTCPSLQRYRIELQK